MDAQVNTGTSILRISSFVVAMMFVEVYFAGPGFAFYRYYKNQLDSKYLPTYQICVNLINCMLWIINARKDTGQDDSELKYTCNILGFSFSSIYVIFLWIIYSRKNIQENGIYLFTFINIFVQFFLVMDQTSSVTYISVSVNIGMYLASMQHVV